MEMNRAIIEAAIIGFERQKQQIDETVAELRHQLDGTAAKPRRKTTAAGTTSTKRVLSAAARKRIAAAQKARWAAFHAKQDAPTKKSTPKKMSPAAKAKLVANLAKARAAKAAKARTATA